VEASDSMTPRCAETIDAVGGRERLLEAAMRLFTSRGYAETSVRDIVAAAGLTAPSLYHHFGNKEGLFLAIIHATQSRVEAARQEVLAGGGSAAMRILRLGKMYVDLRREYADFGWTILRIVSGPKKSAPRFDFRALMLEKTRHFEELIQEGVASGEFGPCEPRYVALALVGAVDIASRPPLFDSGAGGTEVALERMMAVILSGITATRTRTTPRRRTAAGRTAKS
jgi:TetR/AcrR family transcriptional regulator